MLDSNQMDNFLPVQEIARILLVEPEWIIQIARDLDLSIQKRGATEHLSRSDIGRVFQRFREDIGWYPTYYDLPEWLRQCSLPWTRTLVEMYRHPFACPSALSPVQGALISSLIANIAPTLVVEIGSFIGISTLWLAAGLAQTPMPRSLYTIDHATEILPHPPHHVAYISDRQAVAGAFLSQAAIDVDIIFSQQHSLLAAEEFRDNSVDFLYLDGDHTVHGSVADFLAYYPKVSIGGYIVLHDIFPDACNWTGPRFVLDHHVKQSMSLEFIEVSTRPLNYGLAILRKTNRK